MFAVAIESLYYVSDAAFSTTHVSTIDAQSGHTHTTKHKLQTSDAAEAQVFESSLLYLAP